jgi:hypothetical protein
MACHAAISSSGAALGCCCMVTIALERLGPDAGHFMQRLKEATEQQGAPGFSALSTAYLIGAPLVPKLLRTVRHESPAPVSYTLCIAEFQV